MAIKVLSRDSGEGKNCITMFLCDTEADVASLSTEEYVGESGSYCAAGSMAIIADTKEVLILGTQGKWV